MPNSLTPPASCTGCRLRNHECVCAYAPRLDVATRLFVIMHSKEWRRSTNTGHLVRLAMQNGIVRRHGLPHQTVSSAGIDATSRSTLVLYPGRGTATLTGDFLAALPRPLTLLVPDGNWNQTKHMMNRIPMLRQAQPVRLDSPNLALNCLRRNFWADRMSTFEAIAHALGILEGAETQAQLLTFFRHVLASGMHNSRRGQKSHGPNA